jgi:hypothetical protein
VNRTEHDLSTAQWIKSSYSAGDGGNCVEVAPHCAVVPVRDSKRPHGPKLVFPGAAWVAFIGGIQERAL